MPTVETEEEEGRGGADPDDKYRLKRRTEIVQTLLDLSRKPELVSAYFNQGREQIITTVITVLSDHGLVLLELGPDQKKNQKLLSSKYTNCFSKHLGVDVRFRLEKLRTARYQGQTVIAAPLPDNILRLQRREYFRVNTPMMNPLTCTIRDVDGPPLKLPLADLSIGGLSLVDADHALSVEPFNELLDCTLSFPDHPGGIEVDLEVRGVFMQAGGKGEIQRLGCAFVDLPNDKLNFIQRYINRLQLQQRNLQRRD